ncbi:MAG: hypothetical protein DRI57_22765 [Deltaproteobacteria bacterium]|nr:MAG: hypothetical protein DRI57_22765 [Deltaproteobacteria bacterium]
MKEPAEVSVPTGVSAPDVLEAEMQVLLEQEGKMAERIALAKRRREKDALVERLRRMKEELVLLEAPVVVAAQIKNGGDKPEKIRKNVNNTAAIRADYVPVPQGVLQRTVYPKDRRSTTQFAHQIAPDGPQVQNSALSSIIAQNNSLLDTPIGSHNKKPLISFQFSGDSVKKLANPDFSMSEVKSDELISDVDLSNVDLHNNMVLTNVLHDNSKSQVGVLTSDVLASDVHYSRDSCVPKTINDDFHLQNSAPSTSTSRPYRINAAHEIPQPQGACAYVPSRVIQFPPSRFQIPSETEAEDLLRVPRSTGGGGYSDSSGRSESERTRSMVPKRGRKILQSGIIAKATDMVKFPQDWPHIALQSDKVGGCYSFQELDYKLFASGELELISRALISDTERDGRTELLKQLIYLYRVYDWQTILKLYTEVVSKIEKGLLTWSSQFNPTLTSALARQGAVKSVAKTTVTKSSGQKAGKGYGKARPTYCKDFQGNSCPFTEEKHWGMVNGERMQVEHICAACLMKRKEVVGHSESSSDCPCRRH